MSAVLDRFEDPLEPLGIAAGAYLVLSGLGTLAGMPWQTNPDTVAVGLAVVGSLVAIALGAGLAALAWTGR